ncbi:MAG: epoxyqueuosine reductase [Candidatus Abyssobacteria bacterium SURF_17]|uniref:Epoxyqueuosine reductase n=1 Tax=Candidatus Abyssobacteria bacterium SURF_17 TaxID=2093361 RepID=A0A419EXQ5_9BACT|nr:MAG: epoxyqueuosine reductase [Candidatus Abyssubacteria bacterium SURF_17]
MQSLTEIVLDYVMCENACAAGIATVETLAGGPPTADLTYVLPNAKSAVCFALPLDQSLIPPYLAKKDRLSHERDNFRTNFLASGIALGLTRFLEQKGFPSYAVAANEVYRQDTPRGAIDMIPDVSLRYLAVRSGVASFGLSGNVLRKNEGAAIILGAVVTTADLEPTDPLPKEDNYCDNCRLCMASCASSFMDPEEEASVTLGGIEFKYSKRRSYLRCEFVCGGFTGLHSSGKWSTWSPGRFTIPTDEREFMPALLHGIDAYNQRPPTQGGHHHVLMDSRLYLTCGNCQLICHPDKEERKRRHKILRESGVIVQNADGSLDAVVPEVARERLASMDPEKRALYERV